MNQVLFTPAAVLGLLTEIEELRNCEIAFTELSDNSIKLTVNSVDYVINTATAEQVVVDDETVAEVTDVNESSYQILEDSGEVKFEDDEPIQGGLIKELAKTLFLGGLVRLTNKMLTKDQIKQLEKEAKKRR